MTRCRSFDYGRQCELDVGHGCRHANGSYRWPPPPIIPVVAPKPPKPRLPASEGWLAWILAVPWRCVITGHQPVKEPWFVENGWWSPEEAWYTCRRCGWFLGYL